MIALHQLVGPVLFRAALSSAGDVGSARLPADLVPADAPTPSNL